MEKRLFTVNDWKLELEKKKLFSPSLISITGLLEALEGLLKN